MIYDYMNCPCRLCITLVLCRNQDRDTMINRKCPLLFEYLFEEKGNGKYDLYEDSDLRASIVHRVLKQDFWYIGIKKVRKYYKEKKKKRRSNNGMVIQGKRCI